MKNLKNLMRSLLNKYFPRCQPKIEEPNIWQQASAEAHAKQAQRAYEDQFSPEEMDFRIEYKLMRREMELAGHSPMFNLLDL